MNSKIYILIIPVLTVVCSCVAFQYKPPYTYFNHEKHEETVVTHEMDCFSCHRVGIDESDMLRRVERLREMLREADDGRLISEMCHVCHVEGFTRAEGAPSRCTLCHDDVKNMKPDDHKGRWREEHGKAAGGARYAGTCDDCHKQWFCVNCHNMRDSGTSNMHMRTFKLAHVAAAIADPASCGVCHTAGYCRDCHSSY